MNYEPEFGIMADCIFAVYLLWVSRQDIKEMQVVRYSHILGVSAIIIKIFWQKVFIVTCWIEIILAFFVLLITQYISHRLKLYGLADSIVLFLGGMYFLTEGSLVWTLTAYYMFQAIAGILLIVVQSAKGNIKGTGLRKPVPYIPYISVAFFLTKGVL